MNQEYKYNISKRIIKKYLEYLGNILDIEIKRLVHDERVRYNLNADCKEAFPRGDR